MTINQKKSLVAFYISKFNDDAFRELGYGGPLSKAMDDLSVRITGPGVAPNAYLRRRRDEFDVFFDNGRTLGVIPGVDDFHIVSEDSEQTEDEEMNMSM